MSGIMMKYPRTYAIHEYQLNYLKRCLAPIAFAELMCLLKIVSIDCSELIRQYEVNGEVDISELKIICEQLNLGNLCILEKYDGIRNNSGCMLDLAQIFGVEILHYVDQLFWQDYDSVLLVLSNFNSLYMISHKRYNRDRSLLKDYNSTFIEIISNLSMSIIDERVMKIILDELNLELTGHFDINLLPDHLQAAYLYNNVGTIRFHKVSNHLMSDEQIVRRLIENKDYEVIPYIKDNLWKMVSFNQFLIQHLMQYAENIECSFIRYIIGHLLESQKADIDFALCMIKINFWLIELFPESIKNHKCALSYQFVNNHYLVESLLLDIAQIYDKNEIKQLLAANGLLLQYLPLSYRSNEEFVRIAMQQNPFAFDFVGDELKDNENFALQAIRAHPANYECISARLKQSYELAYEVVSINGMALQLISDTWRNHPEIRSIAVKQNHFAEFIS